MRFPAPSGTGILIAAALTAALCQGAPGQHSESQEVETKDAQIREAKGIPPRATPADYQSHAPAGAITIAGEFTGHSIPTPQTILSTEDYIVVEVALFGLPETRVKLSYADFSLRINGK